MQRIIDIPITVQDAIRMGVWIKDETSIPKRIEYGTDGNLYEMSITNGKEYEEGNTNADGS